MENLLAAGLQEDCPPPFAAASNGTGDGKELTAEEAAEGVSTEVFAEYAGRLNRYLQVGPALALEPTVLALIRMRVAVQVCA